MKILIYEGPKKLRVDEAADLPILENQVRIQTMYSGISHGTEMNVYRGNAPFFRRKMDGEVRLFVTAGEHEKWEYPIRSCDPGVWYMGYANVGKVIETGEDVKNIKVGDIVYSNAPHQSQGIKNEEDVIKLPGNVKPEHAVVFTNLMTAYNGILDTQIKLGDTVVISGLGLLGQLLVQMAKMSGAFQVIGIDLFEKRLETALSNGADKVFNARTTPDIAYEVRKLTGNKGADVVIEVSGSQKALNEAIRIAAPDTTVTALGWYQRQCSDLDLSEEFHHNRVTLRCSQTGRVDPKIAHMWDYKRKEKTCLDLLSKLNIDPLLTHRIDYAQASDAFEMVDKTPDDIIQVVLQY